MQFFKRYLKCLWQRKLQIFLFVITFIGICAVSVYSFYNPSHEKYSIVFKYETTDYDLNDLNKSGYVKNVKEEIQNERVLSEYIVLNEYYFIASDGLSASNYTDDKGYNKYKIIDQDNNVLYDDYGIFNRIEDGYILLDDYYYYTKGLYDVTYKSGVVTLKDEESNELTLKAKWNKEFKYSYSSFSYIKYNKISKTTSYKINDDGTIELKCQRRYFNTWQQARRFMMRMANDLSTEKAQFLRGDSFVKSDSKSVQSESVISNIGGVKMAPYAIGGAAAGLFAGFLFVLVLVIIKKEEAVDTLEYDNDKVYKTPFHISYWKKSIKELDSVKKVVTLSMLFAMMQVVRLIPIPSGFGNLGISLSAFFFAIIGLLYGPSIGFIVGLISDIFGYFVFPDGYPFHFGYTLQAGLTGFMYGVCFYKTKISYSKALYARLVINILLNAVLGSIFWGDVADLSYAATKTYFLTVSLPKNIAYLIPQSLLIYLFIKALMPALKSMGLVEDVIADDANKKANIDIEEIESVNS